MGIISGLFKSGDMPTDRTAGRGWSSKVCKFFVFFAYATYNHVLPHSYNGSCTPYQARTAA